MPIVSVLMPCYNAEGTLEEALGSLFSQTLCDFELIAMDDGSTDATPSILQAWAARSPRFRILTRPHLGIVAALNAGLEACSAGYVARMDTDDRAHPERLARQVAFLDDHPEVGLVSCQVAAFPAGQVRGGFQVYLDWLNTLLTDEDIRREIFVESPFPHPSVVFRRQCVIQVGGYQNHGWAEDYDLWMRLYLAGVRFAKLPEVLLEWREHALRLTRTDSRYSLENFLRLKAYYLTRGPLAGRDAVILWGAGMMGRRLSKQLVRQGVPLMGFVDADPNKVGLTRRGLPIFSPQDLPALWRKAKTPILLVAVGAHSARTFIRQRLHGMGYREMQDWLFVA